MTKKTLVSTFSNDNIEFVKKMIIEIDNIENADLLIIDDGSTYNVFEELDEFENTKCIHHENELGLGSCIISTFEYFKNFDYDYLITLNSNTSNCIGDYNTILSNLEYGYDMVNCSRILENYNHKEIEPEAIEIIETISENLSSIVGTTITDPFSFNKGISSDLLSKLEVTENNSNSFLQIIIQSHYYGSTIIEIPSETDLKISSELRSEENMIETSIAVMEAEKYLYNKGTIN